MIQRDRACLLMRGGTVATAGSIRVADILAVDGRISEIGRPGSLRLSKALTIDLDGLLVLPGLVDAHVHLRDPGRTHKEDVGSATRAAAAGGITTLCAMPFDYPPATSGRRLTANASVLEGRAYVDVAMLGAIGPENVNEIAGLVSAGAVGVEVMLAEAPTEAGVPDDTALRAILVEAARHHTVVGVYCDDPATIAAAYRDARASGSDLDAYVRARRPEGELRGVDRVCRAALETKAAVHLRQLSLRGSVERAAAARAAGADVTLEVTPHHLTLSHADALERDLQVLPPLRSADDLAALRAGLLDGTIDIVASDHAPHAEEEKRRGEEDAWLAPPGLPGLETLLPALFEILGARAPALLATVCSAIPARRFGLRTKGRIACGADADFAVVDPSAPWLVDPGRLYTRGASVPFAGLTFNASVHYTIVRGNVVYQDGQVTGEPVGTWVRGREADAAPSAEAGLRP